MSSNQVVVLLKIHFWTHQHPRRRLQRPLGAVSHLLLILVPGRKLKFLHCPGSNSGPLHVRKLFCLCSTAANPFENILCSIVKKYQRGMRNAFGSYPQWRKTPNLYLLAGKSGQRYKLRRRGPKESQDKDSPFTKYTNSLLGGRTSW